MIDARLVYEVSIGDMGPRHVSHWGMSAGSARVTIAVVVTGVSCCCEDEPQQQSPQQPGIRNRTDQQQLSLGLGCCLLSTSSSPTTGLESSELSWCHAQWTRRPICVFWLFSKLLLEMVTI